MAINSLGGTNITPTKPRTSNFYQATAASGTWYTALTSTSGRGNLARVMFANEPAGGVTQSLNRYFEIRITVDGVQNTITGLPTSSLTTRGSNQLFSTANSAGLPIDVFLYTCNIFFRSSLQVEVRQTSGSSYNISAIVDYSLE